MVRVVRDLVDVVSDVPDLLTPLSFAAERISSSSWSETRMKIRLPRVFPGLYCWFLPIGFMLLSIFPDIAADLMPPFLDIAGVVGTIVRAPCMASSKSLRHSGQSPPRRRSGGQFGLCAQTV